MTRGRTAVRSNAQVAVVDIDALVGHSTFDLCYMADGLGTTTKVPLNIRHLGNEIRQDGSVAWFIPEERYVRDRTTAITDKRVYLKDVILRSTQVELERGEQLFIDDPEKLERIYEFLTDFENINFLQTIADTHLLSKEDMDEIIGQAFKEMQSSFAHHFVSSYKAGENPPSGQYALKRNGGNSGKDVYLISVGPEPSTTPGCPWRNTASASFL